MKLRAFEVLLTAGVGWTALAAGSALAASCDQQFERVRSELARRELSGSERPQYDALLQAARAMQQNGKEGLCLEILNQTGAVLQRRAAIPVAPSTAGDGQARAARYAVLKDAEPLAQIARFGGIRDLSVVNPKGEDLGRIIDLVVNFDDHRVQYALLSMSSGLLGDQKLYPVPIEVLKIGDAPEPPPAAAGSRPSAAGAGQAPASTSSASAARDRQDGVTRLGAIAQMKVGDLVGSEVRNGRGDALGKIDAVILPSEAAQIEAVLSVGGLLGIGDRAVAIPLDRLTMSEDGLRFETPITEDELKQLPKVEVSDQERLPDDTVIAEVVPMAAGQTDSRGSPPPVAGVPTPPSAAAQGSVVASTASADGAPPDNPLAHKVLVLDIERATLERAPGFTEGTYPELADPEWHRTVLSFYENVLHLDGEPGRPVQPGAPAKPEPR